MNRNFAIVLVLTMFLSMGCYVFGIPVSGSSEDDGIVSSDDPTATPAEDIPMMPTPGPDEPTFQAFHQIDDVEVLILESSPPQINLHVTGYQGDGCEYPVEVTQSRNGNTITVEIYRTMPLAAACPAIALVYDETISLDGDFEAGQTYTIIVNDFEVTLEL